MNKQTNMIYINDYTLVERYYLIGTQIGFIKRYDAYLLTY